MIRVSFILNGYGDYCGFCFYESIVRRCSRGGLCKWNRVSDWLTLVSVKTQKCVHMLICLGSILLVDMRSIGTSHVRIRHVKYVTSARTYESAESTRLINCSGLMMADPLGRTPVGMAAQFCFSESQRHWFLIQSLYILLIFCTLCPLVYPGINLISSSN